MLLTKKEYTFIIDQLDKQRYDLNEWENGFLDSVKKEAEQDKPLSVKQLQTLSRIWDKF